MSRAVTTAALVLCAAGLTVLTACGGESTAGEPVATDPPESREQPPSEDSPSSASDEPEYSLAQLCGLLEPEEAERMGGSPQGTEGNSISDGHDICTWEDETSLIAGVQPGLDLSSVRPTGDVTVTPTTVEGLPAARKKTASINACEIVVELPSDNLFGVSVAPLSAGEGKYEPCAVADEFAAVTVPRVKDN